MNRDVAASRFWRLTAVVAVVTASLAAGVTALRRGPATDTLAPVAGKAADAALDHLRRHVAQAHGLEVVVDAGAPQIAWNHFALERHRVLDYLRSHVFTFIARRQAIRGALPDVYRARARVNREGVPIEVTDLVNLTRTEHGEESALAVRGPFVAFANRIDRVLKQIVVLDYRGDRSPSLSVDAPSWLDRWMDAVANWQSVRDSRGVGVRTFDLSAGVSAVRLAFRATEGEGTPALEVHATTAAGQRSLSVDPSAGTVREDAVTSKPGPLPLTAVAPTPRTKRMFIDWVANTLRRAIGEERFEWVKVYALALKDKWRRLVSAIFGPSAPEVDETETAPVVAAHAPVRRLLTQFGQDPNWPPPALEPILAAPKLKGEGQWVDIYDFDLRNAGAPPPLLKTILRPDPKRPHAAVRLVLVDPRQVDLGIVAGTRHPESTTGEHGDGLIPRDRGTLSRLLAAFNGGFKTMHGAYGMIVRGKVIVPTKRGAATITKMKDGRVLLGTWDLPDKALLRGAVAIRQNLPPLIESGVVNPTGLKRWGNTVQNLDSDGKHTYRSAIGLTKHNHLLYAWGDDLSHETMAQAMLRAGCDYAIHLDMNYGHSRFEFYRVYDDESIGRARPDRKMYTEGKLRFQAKKLSKAQISWLYPRYLKRDIRDFFYLTLRRVFPYADDDGAPAWTTEGLPEELREWPPFVVRAKVRAGRDEVQLFKLDGARMRLRLRAATEGASATPDPQREIARDDLPRLAAIIGLGTGPTPLLGAAAVRAMSLLAAEDGRVELGAHEGAGRRRTPNRVSLWGRALVEKKKIVLDEGVEAALPEAVRGAVGVDARGDLIVALSRTGALRPLAVALIEAGATRALALGRAGEGAFVRVLTPGEREGEIVATDLASGAREALRAIPLTQTQPFLYALPFAPKPNAGVLSLAIAEAKTRTPDPLPPTPARRPPRIRRPATPRAPLPRWGRVAPLPRRTSTPRTGGRAPKPVAPRATPAREQNGRRGQNGQNATP
jgi:hypothetical protein